MDNTVFLDCLGREIKVGDVVAYGHRVGSCLGGITVGVVTGFEGDKILVTKFVRGRWYEGVYKRWWTSTNKGDAVRVMKGRWSHSDRCCITGMTEDDLRKAVKIEESEEAPCVSLD